MFAPGISAGSFRSAGTLIRLDAAEGELAALKGRATRSEARLQRVQAEEYWDRVVREVREIIPEGGSLRIGQILPRLRPETARGRPTTART